MEMLVNFFKNLFKRKEPKLDIESVELIAGSDVLTNSCNLPIILNSSENDAGSCVVRFTLLKSRVPRKAKPMNLEINYDTCELKEVIK